MGLFFKVSTFNAFTINWNTALTSAGSSNNDQIKLPLSSTGIYDFYVDWGDGNKDHITAFNDAAVTHTYSVLGLYTTNIIGLCQGFRFNVTGDRLKILVISNWGCLRGDPLVIPAWFASCTALTVTATDKPFLGTLTTLQSAFNNCDVLTQVPGFDTWNTAAITNFSSCFTSCNVFNQNLNALNVSAATNISNMFSNCPLYNQPMNSWNVGNVTNLSAAIANDTAFDQDISAWNISKVTTGTSFALGCTLSKANYNKLLATWSAITSPQVPRSNVTISFGNSHYDASTGGYDGTAGRAVLTGTYTWTITDGGTP